MIFVLGTWYTIFSSAKLQGIQEWPTPRLMLNKCNGNQYRDGCARVSHVEVVQQQILPLCGDAFVWALEGGGQQTPNRYCPGVGQTQEVRICGYFHESTPKHLQRCPETRTKYSRISQWRRRRSPIVLRFLIKKSQRHHRDERLPALETNYPSKYEYQVSTN